MTTETAADSQPPPQPTLLLTPQLLLSLGATRGEEGGDGSFALGKFSIKPHRHSPGVWLLSRPDWPENYVVVDFVGLLHAAYCMGKVVGLHESTSYRRSGGSWILGGT